MGGCSIFRIILSCFFILFLKITQIHANEKFSVEWYEPKIKGAASDGLVPVIISGKTKPNSIVLIPLNRIVQLKSLNSGSENVQNVIKACKAYSQPDEISEVIEELKEGQTLWVEEVNNDWVKAQRESGTGFIQRKCLESKIKSETSNIQITGTKKYFKTRSSEEGNFEASLNLPVGLVQIPIKIYYSKKNKKTFMVLLEVDYQNVSIQAKVKKKDKNDVQIRNLLWVEADIGLFGYQKFKQDLVDLATGLNFTSAITSSWNVGVGGRMGHWGGQFKYSSYPSGISTSDSTFILSKSKYSWNTMVLEGIYLLNYNLLDMDDELQLIFGTQYHTVPFLKVTPPNLIQTETPSIVYATIGINLQFPTEGLWKTDFSLIYFYPISSSGTSGDSWSIKPNRDFDFSCGFLYSVSQKFNVGLYWINQWHDFNVNYKPSNSSTTYSGTESLSLSQINLKFKYQF